MKVQQTVISMKCEKSKNSNESRIKEIFGKRSVCGNKWFYDFFWTSLLLYKVSRKSYEIIYLVSVNWSHCVRARQYFSPGDFGECLFTHLFWAKIGPNKPKTNQNCQRMYVFVFVNVQERIFKKRTKNHEKMTKRARDLEKCQ